MFDRLEWPPLGWKSLVEELKTDLAAMVEEYGLIHFEITEAKEKWGTMVIYADGVSEEAWDTWVEISSRYEELFTFTCLGCGKTTNRRKGFALCDNCAAKQGTKNLTIFKNIDIIYLPS